MASGLLNPNTMKKYISAISFLICFNSLIAQHFEPVWETPFNPMNVYITSAELNGVALGTNDEIGIFDIDGTGNEFCVGAVTLEEQIIPGEFIMIVCSMDDGISPDVPNGFIQGNPFIFRYFSADFNIEIEGVDFIFPYPGYAENFTILGSAFVDVSATYLLPEIHTIHLPQGWCGLSSYLNPLESETEVLFESIYDDLIICISDNFEVWWPSGGLFSLHQWDPYQGYRAKLQVATDLNITGTALVNKTILLSEDWKQIPVLSSCVVNVDDLFEIPEVIIVKEIAGYNLFWPEYNINTLNVLEPGKSYFVLMNSEVEITFPQCDDHKKDIIINQYFDTKEIINKTSWEVFEPTSITHIVVIPNIAMPNLQIDEGAIIGTFDNDGNCFGIAQWQGENTSITLFGDDPMTPQKDGFYEGDFFSMRYLNPKESKEVILNTEWNISLPQHNGVFMINGLSVVSRMLSVQDNFHGKTISGNLTIFPNPSKGIFNLSGLDKNALVSVFNAFGEEIFINEILPSEEIDLTHQPDGVYFVRIKSANSSIIKKLVKE